MVCPSCANELPDDSKFCQYCGFDLAMRDCCFGCGTKLLENMKYCPKCGRRVQDTDMVANIPVQTEEIPVVEPSFAKTAYQTEISAQQISDDKDDQIPSSTPYKSQAPNVPNRAPKAAKKSRFLLIMIGIAIILAGIFFVIWRGNRKDVSLADCAENVLYLEIYDSSQKCIGTGSGFLINDKRTLVTNYHVIEEAYRITVTTADGSQVVAADTVLAYDKVVDLAVLKCLVDMDADPLTLADSNRIKQGDKIYAAGYPLGIANTLSDGIISSRYIDENGVELLQITAPISGGSSGGAVLNESGEVVGIVSAYYEDGQNINIAIAASMIDIVLKENKPEIELTQLYRNNHPLKLKPTIIPDQSPNNQAILDTCKHTDGTWFETKEATCSQAGVESRKCSACGEIINQRVLDKIPHNEVADPAIAATCTSDGKTKGSHCSMCGKTIVAQTSLPATGHRYSEGKCKFCGEADPSQLSVTSISIDRSNIFVEVGASVTLTANVAPAGATTKITWTSSDPDRISVKNGVVTVHSSSNVSADITAITDNGLTATCKVYAKQKSPIRSTGSGLVYEKFPTILSMDNLFTGAESIAFWYENVSEYTGTHFYSYSALTNEKAEYYAHSYVDYLIANGYAYVGQYGDTNRFILNDPSGKYEVQVREEGESWWTYHSVTVWVSML